MMEDVANREREAVIHDLASPDEEIRRLAVERLLSLPTVDALPRLLVGLGDSSWRVRKAVVERLVACGETDLVDAALVEALADGENPGRRNSASEALVRIGDRLTGRLVAVLESNDVDVRKLAIDSLAGIGDTRACDAVVRMLDDSDANVRGAAADALAIVGDESAALALQRAAVDQQEDQLVRLSALRALARMEHPLTDDELGPVLGDPVLRPAAFTLLGQLGDAAAVSCLLKGLALDSRPSREAAMAALLHVLSEADGARVDELVRAIREASGSCENLLDLAVERLTEADLTTRLMLIQFLGLTQDSRCVVPILEAGRDEAIAEVAHSTLEEMPDVTVTAFEAAWSGFDAELRSDACSLLGTTGGEKATGLLLSSLDDADAGLRSSAARALGRLKCVDAIPELVRRLESAALDDDPESEEEVDALIEALVSLASPWHSEATVAGEVIELLSTRLAGAQEEVRLAIATVLGRIGRHEDEELVARLLKDPSPRVRRAAVEALERLEPGAASEPLRLALADESSLVRIAAAVALGNSQNPAVIDDLPRLIHDEDSRVSAAAVHSIGMHCQRDGVPVEQAVHLIGHALRSDAMVALAGVEALRMIGGERAATAALAMLDRHEPELVQAAVACIGAHGDMEAVSELLSVIAHANWSVRAEAIQILAERRIRRAVPAMLRRLETEQDSFVRDAILRALRQLED